MIITWYTDPSKGTFTPGSGKFSSYYQYDTTTKKFVRIRLELERNSSGSDEGHTGGFYNEKRYVGFGDGANIRTSQKEKWSVNDKGDLCYDSKPLEASPKPGMTTFDSSSRVFAADTFIHRGNPVTDKANLPDGIGAEHLSLLANECIIKESNIGLSPGYASPEDLSDIIKLQVSGVFNNKPFAEITDADILSKLKSQITEIKTKAVAKPKDSLNSSLEEVDKLIEDIKTQMIDEGLAPTEKFETAFKDLAIKVAEAKTASANGKGIKDAIVDLAKSKSALNEAASDLSEAHYVALKDQFTQSDTAIKTAQEDSETWESIDAEYQDAEEATSIEDYEKSIGNEEIETE